MNLWRSNSLLLLVAMPIAGGKTMAARIAAPSPCARRPTPHSIHVLGATVPTASAVPLLPGFCGGIQDRRGDVRNPRHLNLCVLQRMGDDAKEPIQSVQVFGRKKSATAVAYCKRGKGLIKVEIYTISLNRVQCWFHLSHFQKMLSF